MTKKENPARREFLISTTLAAAGVSGVARAGTRGEDPACAPSCRSGAI